MEDTQKRYCVLVTVAGVDNEEIDFTDELYSFSYKSLAAAINKVFELKRVLPEMYYLIDPGRTEIIDCSPYKEESWPGVLMQAIFPNTGPDEYYEEWLIEICED